MNRRNLARAIGTAVFAAAGLAGRARAATVAGHRIAFHVGAADPVLMRIALNNIAAAEVAYAAKGEPVAIELVADGGGYTMLRADKSPVADQVAALRRRYPAVVFSACQNSRRGQAAAEGKAPEDIPELEGVTDVPAGVVRLAELQEQGWSYIRV